MLDTEVREMQIFRSVRNIPSRIACSAQVAWSWYIDDIHLSLKDADSIERPRKATKLKEEVRQEQLRSHTPSGWPVRGTITSRYGTRRSPLAGDQNSRGP